MSDLPPQQKPVTPPRDPTKTNRTWTIALVTSAVFLLAAIGVVIWMVVARSALPPTTPPPQTDPAIGVKNVTFVPSADIPPTFIKRDQSRVGESLVFYDDEGTGCSVVQGVLPYDSAKSPQEITLERLAAAYAEGVTTIKASAGERLVFKDDAREYSFETVETEQSVNLKGVGFGNRSQTTAFAKLGNQVVVIGYGCKTEVWAQKQQELAAIAAKITLKTER